MIDIYNGAIHVTYSHQAKTSTSAIEEDNFEDIKDLKTFLDKKKVRFIL